MKDKIETVFLGCVGLVIGVSIGTFLAMALKMCYWVWTDALWR